MANINIIVIVAKTPCQVSVFTVDTIYMSPLRCVNWRDKWDDSRIIYLLRPQVAHWTD